MVSYRESSSGAAPRDAVRETAYGFVVLGGVDFTVTRWVRVGGEFRYRAVNGILGTGGVSELYGEKSVGGYGFGVRIAIGR